MVQWVIICLRMYLLEAEIVQDGEIKATAKGKSYDQPDLVDVLGPFS
jgi:hypothetical protein